VDDRPIRCGKRTILIILVLILLLGGGGYYGYSTYGGARRRSWPGMPSWSGWLAAWVWLIGHLAEISSMGRGHLGNRTGSCNSFAKI
jgi:hypothetical protein